MSIGLYMIYKLFFFTDYNLLGHTSGCADETFMYSMEQSELIPDPVVEKRVALYNLGIWDQ